MAWHARRDRTEWCDMGLLRLWRIRIVEKERVQMRKAVREVAYLFDHLLGGVGGGLGQRGAGQHTTVTLIVQLQGGHIRKMRPSAW